MNQMSYQPLKQSQDDIQFKIVSKSYQYKPLTDHQNLHTVSNTQRTNQIIMNDSVDAFNDAAHEGVEPSINETIRESISYSFVSSECAHSKRQSEVDTKDLLRDQFVMNRMNWINYLKVLFDQLESFNQNKQKHVETFNFLKGLKKIKNLLPLQSRNDYYKNCSEVAFTYIEVEKGVSQMPKYITWDNIIDVFLSKQYQQSMISNPKATQAFKQIDSEDGYPQPQQIDESQIFDFNEEDDKDQNFNNKGNNKITKQQSKLKNQNLAGNPQRNDFILSFADSLIIHGNQTADYQNQQQYLAQAPLLMGNPTLGLMDKDEDEACEIDSDNSQEESKDISNSRRQKSKLEESIRSSRTATFKCVRRTSTQNNNNNGSINNQNNLINNAITASVNVQDSYYATLKNSKPQNYQSLQLQQQQPQIYYQQQNNIKTESRNSSTQFIELEDGQVEVGSTHSINSSRWKIVDNGGVGSNIPNDQLSNYEEQIGVHNEKSTRISSLNSIQKNLYNQNNNTILSNNSSQSSHSYNKLQNNSKISGASHQSSQNQSNIVQSNTAVDLDFQGKGLRNFDMDFKAAYGDKKQLRSINLSINSLVKLPPSLEKSLQFINISYNKLKSLQGIECCVNLKFLNATGNLISSAQSLVLLQSLRELLFASNQLSLTKELGQLKNLCVLDLSSNKLIEFEKLVPLSHLKKLTVLCLKGNLMQKIHNYEQMCQRMLPQVKVLDPDSIRDYSQFCLENMCFTNQPQVIVDQLSQANLKKYGSIEKQQEKPRSRTPNREREKSQKQEKQLKSTVISPKRSIEQSYVMGKQTNSSQKINQVSKYNIVSPKASARQNLNENQFKLSTKISTSALSAASSKLQKPAVRHTAAGLGIKIRERSYTNEENTKTPAVDEEDKSYLKDRSSSNISRNNQVKHQFSQQQPSGRSTAGAQKTYSTQSQQQPIKKISVNVNLSKALSSVSNKTPTKSKIQTPQQEQQITHYYKKSFQTDDGESLQNINEMQNTPSEKNAIRVAQTQESSNKKGYANSKDQSKVANSSSILSPGSKMIKANIGRNNNVRPVTTLKQRVVAAYNNGIGYQKNDSLLQNYQSAIYNTNNSVVNVNMQFNQNAPQSTRNDQRHSHSFIVEPITSSVTNTGRQTPSQQMSNRSSSQLQKFMNDKPTNQSQLQMSRLTQKAGTSMLIHQIPSQKLTNLPPRAYQNKGGNPGDKKSKADMSSSMISQHQQNNVSQNRNQASVLQNGGGTIMEDDSRIESIGSRSMSPVLEESSNIRKLKVDLTQFMNKQ